MQSECFTLTLKLRDRTLLAGSIPWPNKGFHSIVGHHVSNARKNLLTGLMRKAASEKVIHAWDIDRMQYREGCQRVTHDVMGKPRVHRYEGSGPAVSFSYGADRLWAALGDCSIDIGVDIADPCDFQGNYPFHQAFLEADWSEVPCPLHRQSADAAAFVWSLKEAAVKALGSGFHYFGPLDVAIRRSQDRGGDMLFEFVFSPADHELAESVRYVRVVAAAWRMGRFWLALASCGRHAAEPFRQSLFTRRAIHP